jgi:hypothetical protein
LRGNKDFGKAPVVMSLEDRVMNHVPPLDPLDFASQIDDLRVLQDGWYDGRGKAPSAMGLDWLLAAFVENYPDDLPQPYVYPVAEGDVRLEWDLGSHSLSLEIDPIRRIGLWHDLDLNRDHDESQTLAMDHADGWSWVANRIQELSGGPA